MIISVCDRGRKGLKGHKVEVSELLIYESVCRMIVG
jgi:hypothetical protein